MPWTIDFSGKKVLVTGSTRGIGLGISREFARAGARVVGCSRSGAGSDEERSFLETVSAAGGRGEYYSADLSRAEEIATLVDRISGGGSLDFVISNAGRNVFKGIDHCDESAWDQCMNLDLASHWRLAKAMKPLMEKSAHPVFLAISSNHALSTIAGCFPYNVAKAGINAMVQSLAIEWGPRIRAVGVAPGFIDTPGNDAWFAGFPDPAAERKRTEKLHPAGRIGTPEEIGGLCVFLCSPYARFICGTTLLVDGGRSALMQDS
jgi:NAD(P)-dependent dehydrogenase (short-subunit alcohol dehydrogenase family)